MDTYFVADGRVAGPFGLLIAVSERRHNPLRGCRIHVHVYSLAMFDCQLSQIVHAEDMVSVRVGEHHCVEVLNVSADQLFTHIRPGVDQYGGDPVRALFLDKHCTSAATVPGIVRVACTPVIADARNTAG